jgi:putative salt-induced outer membrane protein YdiY
MFRRISIVLALCACCSAARGDTIRLANGDSLNGEIIEWALDYVVIEHPQLGQMRLSLEQLEIDTGKRPSPGLFGTTFMRGWKRSIDLGWTGDQGTTDNLNLTTGLDFSYADEFKRWAIRGRQFYSEEDEGVTDNNARIDLRRDWLFPGSRWFAFVSSRYQYDEFESWEHRTTLTSGPGYELIGRESNHRLDGRLGAAFTREFGDRDESQGEGLLAFDYYWEPAERYSVSITNQLFTEVQPDIGEIRNLTIGELKVRLFEEPALSLKTGVENEYESDVEGDDEKNNLKYYISLGIDF